MRATKDEMDTTMSSTDHTASDHDTVDEGRRDFIHLLAIGTAAAAGGAAVVPLVGQMAPDAAVRALATKEVSISAVEKGQAVKVVWQGKPVFIRRLTDEEKEREAATPLSDLKDRVARNTNLGPKDDAEEANRIEKDDFVIVLGVCTHLGCVPLGTAEGEPRGDFGGWFCPCHGSHYDALGRIRKGPAPQNLEVPPLEFITDSTVRLG